MSRHRRSYRLPRGREALVELGVPAVLLTVLGAAAIAGWALAPMHSGPLPAGATLVLVLVSLVLVYAVGWRTRLGIVGAGVAAALFAVSPPAVRASAIGVPEHLAVALLLGAVLLVTIRNRRRILLPVAALLAGAAAAVAPLALAAAPFLAWHSFRAVRRRHRVPTLPLAGAVYFAAVGIGWALLGLDTVTEPVAGTGLLSDWVRSAPIGAAVGLAAVLGGVLTPALRPLAGYAATLLVLSVWPDGDQSVRYTVLLAPAVALLTGALTARAVAALGRSRSGLLAAAACAAVALAVGAGIAGSVLDLNGEDQAAATPPSSPAATRSPEAGSASPAATPDPASRERRASAGSQLAVNPRLTITPSARQSLEDGDVDRRIAIVLGQLLGEHDLTVADFPVAAGDDPGVRRSVLVSQMDGNDLGPGGASMTALTSYLTALTGTFAVESVSVTSDGVLATFPPAAL